MAGFLKLRELLATTKNSFFSEFITSHEMASLLKSIFHPKYGPAHLFAMFPVLQACSSSTKNDEEAWHNKTPPIKRYSERNANGRFGVRKRKIFPLETREKEYGQRNENLVLLLIRKTAQPSEQHEARRYVIINVCLFCFCNYISKNVTFFIKM